MNIGKLKPLVQFAGLLTLIVVGVLISMQGFHHHDTLEDEQACTWHNVIPMGFILTSLLVVVIMLNSSGWIILPLESAVRDFTKRLSPELLNLPP